MLIRIYTIQNSKLLKSIPRTTLVGTRIAALGIDQHNTVFNAFVIFSSTCLLKVYRKLLKWGQELQLPVLINTTLSLMPLYFFPRPAC